MERQRWMLGRLGKRERWLSAFGDLAVRRCPLQRVLSWLKIRLITKKMYTVDINKKNAIGQIYGNDIMGILQTKAKKRTSYEEYFQENEFLESPLTLVKLLS